MKIIYRVLKAKFLNYSQEAYLFPTKKLLSSKFAKLYSISVIKDESLIQFVDYLLFKLSLNLLKKLPIKWGELKENDFL